MKVNIKEDPKNPGWYILDYRPDGAKGKRVREPVKGRRDAEERAAEIEGKPLSAESVTFPRLEDVEGEYMAWCDRNLAVATCIGKRVRLEKHIIPALGQYRAHDLSQRILDGYAADLPKTTTLLDLRHVKAMIGWMVKRRYAEPLTWVPEMPGYRPKIKRLPDAAGIKIFLSAVKQERHRVACLMMLLAGLRWSEVKFLRWENYRDGAILMAKTKTDTDEIITIPRPCMEWFKAYQMPSGYVFSAKGGRTPPSGIRRQLMDASEQTGIKMSPHMFRHMSATALYELTDDIYAVQHHLRHTRVETTQIYTRYSAVRRKGSVDALTDAFDVDKKGGK